MAANNLNVVKKILIRVGKVLPFVVCGLVLIYTICVINIAICSFFVLQRNKAMRPSIGGIL